MLGLQTKTRTSLVCLGMLLISAVLHIAYGSEFLNWGSFRQQRTGNPQDYDNTVPLAIFTITFGVYLILSTLFLGYSLIQKQRMGMGGELVLWLLAVINALFTFAAGMMLVRQYSRQVQAYSAFDRKLPTQSQFQVPLYLGLCDGIVTFVLAFPASFVLLHLSNVRMAQAKKQNKLVVVPSGKVEPEEEEFEEDPSVAATMSKHQTRNMGFDDRKEIEEVLKEEGKEDDV